MNIKSTHCFILITSQRKELGQQLYMLSILLGQPSTFVSLSLFLLLLTPPTTTIISFVPKPSLSCSLVLFSLTVFQCVQCHVNETSSIAGVETANAKLKVPGCQAAVQKSSIVMAKTLLSLLGMFKMSSMMALTQHWHDS